MTPRRDLRELVDRVSTRRKLARLIADLLIRRQRESELLEEIRDMQEGRR